MKIFYYFAFLMTIIIMSCDKSYVIPTDTTSYQIEKFGRDELVHQYILEYFSQYERIQDVTLLEKAINNQSVTLDETSDIHMIFGYSNYDVFYADIVKQRKRAQELDRRYGLKNQPDSLIINGVLEAFEILDIYGSMNSPYSLEKTCERIRRNCISKVAAQAVGGHFACGVLDISVIGGIFCHGAALVYQWTAGNNCNLQAGKCREDSRRKVVKIIK